MSLLTDLGCVCTELRSEKPVTRNKAAEKLDALLTSSKFEVIELFRCRSEDAGRVSYPNLFNSAVEATIQHARKLEECREAKNLQTMRNKNYLFRAIVTRLVDYNLEDNNNFIPKSIIFDAFTHGFEEPSALVHFSSLFLNVLERGIFKSPVFVLDLKVNEFSRILSYLFQVRLFDIQRLKLLHTINTAIELAAQHVQINDDLIVYLPQLMEYATDCKDDASKAEVIRLFYLFISELAIDYHYTICTELQQLLPVICSFYDFRMRNETKEILFHAIYLYLHVVYPQINSGDINTFGIVLSENWALALRKLDTIIEVEIREQSVINMRSTQALHGKCLEHFVQMAALVIYLIHWHVDSANSTAEDAILTSRRAKIARKPDKLEIVLNLVQTEETKFNKFWLAIMSELVVRQETVINVINLQSVMVLSHRILLIFANEHNLRYLRICLTAVLGHEQKLIAEQSIAPDYCHSKWSSIVDFLISENSTTAEVIAEKQQMLQALIAHGKLSQENCHALLNAFIANTLMKRTECIQTVRQMLIHADLCGMNKTGDIVGRLLTWMNEASTKLDARIALHNVAPIDAAIIADTSAIAVINFLVEMPTVATGTSMASERNLQLLLYKHNRKLVCLEQHGSDLRRLYASADASATTAESIKNCLFQDNYELLMRLLNFEGSQDATCRHIAANLMPLLKMCTQLRCLLEYDALSKSNMAQCPLVKRIGFFLSHLGLQVKSNHPTRPQNFEHGAMKEILQRLDAVFKVFTGNAVLLQYLQTQPLDEIIKFLGVTLKFSSAQQLQEFANWSVISGLCLHVLARIAASASHFSDAFLCIQSYKLNVKTELNVLLTLVEILTAQQNPHANVAEWLNQMLKPVFRLYYTNIEIMGRVVELLPAVFTYVQQYDVILDNMLIALHSLLKTALKKSYPARLTSQLLDSVRWIARYCQSIFAQQNSINICLSIAKFLPFPSLHVQFVTVNTISALLDVNWLCKRALAPQVHFSFSYQLYEHINLKTLPMSNIDLQQNSSSIGVQVMGAVFVFSAYFRAAALESLAFFCAENKLTEAHLYAFQQIADYNGSNLAQLTRPYANHLIHSWAAKLQPILKMPYFVCGLTLPAFVQENLATIVIALLLHGKAAAELKALTKYKPQGELLALALPIAHALTLPYRADCPEAQAFDFKNRLETLADNFNAFGIDVLNYSEAGILNWQTLYSVLTLLHDEEYFADIVNFPLYYQARQWFNISASSLRKCLTFYITDRACEELENLKFYTVIASKGVAMLVRAFGAMKRDVLLCANPVDAVKQLSVLCTAADVIIDMIPSSDRLPAAAQNCAKFVVRSILCFMLQLLRTADDHNIQKVSIIFLQHFLNKPIIMEGICIAVLIPHMNDVFKALIHVAEGGKLPGIEHAAIALMEAILNKPNAELIEAFTLLDEFPMSESFAELRRRQAVYQQCSDGEKDMAAAVESFLRTKNRGVEGVKAMRHYLARNKQFLQVNGNNNLVGVLVKRLIEMVRSPGSSSEYGMEAAKCLGEIGSLRIEGTAYYFQTDAAFYDDETAELAPLEAFMHCLLVALEANLFDFRADTYEAVCTVLEQVINSKPAEKMLKDFAYLSVLRTPARSMTKGDFNISADVAVIDWTAVLQSAQSASTYEQWVCAVVANVFTNCNWQAFHTLAALDSSFADATLLPIIKLLLQQNHAAHLGKLLAMLDEFFIEFAKVHAGTEPVSGTMRMGSVVIYKEKRIISKMLNICECVRLHNKWRVPADLLNVVRACNYCQAYFMAILYLEMWAVEEKAASSREMSSNHKILANEQFQECATKAYQSVGCSDAIAGFLDPLKSRLLIFQLNNCWSDMLVEASSSSDELLSNELYDTTMKRNGMYSLAGLLMQAQQKQTTNFELCWRLCLWDTDVDGHAKVNALNDLEHEYEKHHFNALKCLFKREENNSLAALSKARHCVLAILKDISVECLQSVYKYLTWMQLLQQIEDFCLVQFATAADVACDSAAPALSADEIFEKWQNELDLQYGSFPCKEQVVSHQVALFQTAGVRASRRINAYYPDNPIALCTLKCARECKLAGEMNLAKSNMAALRKMPVKSVDLKAAVMLEDAEICFRTASPQISKAILQSFLKTPQFMECAQYRSALRMYGEHLLESNMENFETVLRKYFDMSAGKSSRQVVATAGTAAVSSASVQRESTAAVELSAKRSACEVIAKYADREYTQLNTFVNSDEFQMKRRIMTDNREAANRNADRTKNLSCLTMKRSANLDEREIVYIESKRSESLCTALQHYISYCQIDESNSTAAIYRIIALWFANKQLGETLHEKIAAPLALIPSQKFICALNQMTARLNSNNAPFLDVLEALLVRCVQEYPQQTLYHLYPLIYDDNGAAIEPSSDKRARIAKAIIELGTNAANEECIQQLQLLFPALIAFANFKVTGKTATLPLSVQLKRLRDLHAVQCPTIELAARASGVNTITAIHKWEEQVTLVGGINAPKKLICLCTDGQRRPQLLKGTDDLRQDAVMQQVFSLINEMLASEPKAVERKLQLRTYKIVPLSMRSGILQWCENAMPIGVYLCGTGDGKNGAHARYHPDDLQPVKCRQIFHGHLKADAAKRREVYLKLCAKLRPAFHYFLFEKFLVPGVWFERRLAYTNSVATTSMVGCMVGLGDRHAQNILIDERTAEVIHIDFGIAFEQGKIMPTPEAVPFRLTRDMVAPMGVCETNGVFKKSCELTMQLLRRNQAVITTILEVLLYSPLYMWRVVSTANDDDDNKQEHLNNMAQRALLCVQNKLEGRQAGVPGTSDVEAQVQRLINEAVSPDNLSQMFSGWDSYL